MIIINIEDDFDLKKIADSGQCFRWQPIEDGGYRIIHRDMCLCIWRYCDHFESIDKDTLGCEYENLDDVKDKSCLYILDCTKNEYEKVWSVYLDMDEIYSDIRTKIDKNKDSFLYEAAEHERGIRILRQDPWEALVSFIISQNRNIPAIKASIEKLSERAGEQKMDSRGEVYYTFPTAKAIVALPDELLAECKLGYRDKYIRCVASMMENGELDLMKVDTGTDDEVLTNLTGLYGVGKKVASCMLLFGLHHLNAFPVDVWIKKVLDTEYADGYPFDDYSPYNGVYQQYMFAYYRNR